MSQCSATRTSLIRCVQTTLQQCRHLLSAQQEDTDDTDAGEEDEEDSDENILFVPEPYDDFTPEEAQLQLQTDNFDSI